MFRFSAAYRQVPRSEMITEFICFSSGLARARFRNGSNPDYRVKLTKVGVGNIPDCSVSDFLRLVLLGATACGLIKTADDDR